MSNFKKVILFVSMIAVLVSSFMLPTFADDADYPLTDPYREGYNGKVFSVGVNMNNIPTATVTEYIGVPPSTPMNSFTVCIHTGDTVYTYTPDDTNSCLGYRIIAYSNGTIGITIVSLITSDLSVVWDYNTGVARVRFSWRDYDYSIDDNVTSISIRYYGDYSQLSFQNNSMNNRPSSDFYLYTIIDTVDYHEREFVYNNGITAGIQQGYQNGYDEGYQEGYASAGGSFADIVSNPEPGYGVPDVQIDIQPKPQDYIYPSDTEYYREYLARFKVSTGSILRVSDGVEMLPGLYSMECQWLGNDPGDPPTGKGYVFYFYNDDESIHGTLWYTIDAIGDGDTIAANAWYWFPDYKMNGSVSVAPYRVDPRNVQAWVHGDSTALLESKPLTDDGFYITYPYMGEEFYTNGYDRGYDNGLEDGFNGADTSQAWMNLKDTIFVIFDAPFYVISQSLNFDLFGINIAGAIISIISVALIVFILKIIIVRLF